MGQETAMPATAVELTSSPRILPQTGHGRCVEDLAWSPDGRVIATAGDGSVRLWDAAGRGLLQVIEGLDSWFPKLAWNPNGREIVTACGDGSLRAWEVPSGDLLRSFEGHSESILALAWDRGGEKIATGSVDRSLRIWDVASGEQLRVLADLPTSVTPVAWDPAGERLAYGCESEVRISDAVSGRLLLTLEGHEKWAKEAVWDPTGERIATSCAKLGVRIWDADSGQLLHTLEREHVRSLAWDPAGEKLCLGTFNSIEIWEVATQKLWGLLAEASWGAGRLTWHPEGRQIAAEAHGGAVKIWDCASGQLQHTYEGLGDPASVAAWAPGARRVALVFEQQIQVLDAATGRLLHTLDGHEGPVDALAWDPAGERLASASADDYLRIWDGGSGRFLGQLEGFMFGIESLAWDPGGERVAASSDEGIRVWSAQTRQILVDVDGFHFSDLVLSPDGQRIAAVDDVETLSLRDAATGELLASSKDFAGTVESLAWDSSGERLLSAEDDGTLSFWDGTSLQRLAKWPGHHDKTRSAAWDPSGERFASAADDCTVKIWDAASQRLLHTLDGSRDGTVTYLAPGRLAVRHAAGYFELWDLSAVPTRLARLYAVAPYTGLVVTAGGFVDGPPEALERVKMVDGWTLRDLEDFPERRSPERVREALGRMRPAAE